MYVLLKKSPCDSQSSDPHLCTMVMACSALTFHEKDSTVSSIQRRRSQERLYISYIMLWSPRTAMKSHPPLCRGNNAPFLHLFQDRPANSSKYNVDKDFVYYFFNDFIAHFAGMTSPQSLTNTGDRNAKTDLFPVD